MTEEEVDLSPLHPGETLLEEWLKPYSITPYRLAKDIDVPLTRITAILAGRRGITADTALRLGRYFSTGPQMWLNLQARYETETARRALSAELEKIVPLPRPESMAA